MLGTLVVFYLFLGGCGAGVMGAVALWSLAFHRTRIRTRAQTAAFEDLRARCYLAGFAMLAVAALCLLLDLGRPELFYLLFARPTSSILTFGSFTLAASLTVGAFLVAANVLYLPLVHAVARRVAEALCVVASACMMLYTGVYVASVVAVPLWNNVAVPALFALSSLSSGLSVVFIVLPFVRDERLLDGWAVLLHRAHLGVIALELLAFATFFAGVLTDPFAGDSLGVLLDRDGFGGWLFVGAVGAGMLLPGAVEAYQAASRRMLRVLPVDGLCIAGGLALRFCIIWSGSH